MSRQLPADCLNEIFEYMDEEKYNLHSCLLANHLWFEISVRILWRNIWNFNNFNSFVTYEHQLKVESSILSTLVACLPNESKDLLHKNEIFISTPTSKPPLFNYVVFCKVLSIHKIDQMVEHVLQNQQLITPRSLMHNKYLVLQEILKMFMKHISSLKELKYNLTKNIPNIPFTYFPGAIDCLTDITVLSCISDIHSEFFYQLSQICYNIQSLIIEFECSVSDGLKVLVSSQTNLKYLSLLLLHNDSTDWTEIIPSLTEHSNTLIKLNINEGVKGGPISFINIFTNLQELILSSDRLYAFGEFDSLQNAIFPHLQILKIPGECPNHELLIKFLENNGKDLKELYIFDCNNQLNLAIAKFCPNLRKLKWVSTMLGFGVVNKIYQPVK